jgi:hypothetical protein
VALRNPDSYPSHLSETVGVREFWIDWNVSNHPDFLGDNPWRLAERLRFSFPISYGAISVKRSGFARGSDLDGS